MTRFVEVFGRCSGLRQILPAAGTLGGIRTRILWGAWSSLLFFIFPTVVEAQFTYFTNNNAITITGGCLAGAVVLASICLAPRCCQVHIWWYSWLKMG